MHDELMVASRQLTLLLDSEGKYRKETVSYADADEVKIFVLKDSIQFEFDKRYESLKSHVHFYSHRSGSTTLGNIIEKYEACLSVDIDSTVR